MFRLFGLAVLTLTMFACDGQGWRDKRNDSAGVAPGPDTTPEAVVQVYGAAVYGWRGVLADHTWVAVKPAGAGAYTVYQVIGWRLRRGQSVVSVAQGTPDRFWYGSTPTLHLDLRGDAAQDLVEPIRDAARSYPHAHEYTMWPGPNSNSFVQWIALEVPGLGLDLPWRAWGKNWMTENYPVSSSAD